MEQEEFNFLQEMLEDCKKKLPKLEQQALKLGALCPPYILVEIDETKEKIDEYQQKIQNAVITPLTGREIKNLRITGRITYANGKPLGNASVEIEGPAKSGQILTYNPPKTDGDGVYSINVVPGMYKVSAKYSTIFGGRQWTFPLQPNDNSLAQVDPAAGVTKDFSWQIRGTQTGGDPYNAYDHYGGFIFVTVLYKDGQTRNIFDSAQLEFQLVPISKLVDGSEGQAITIMRTGKEIKTPHGLMDSREVLNTRYLSDIPIGLYRLTVKRLGMFGGLLNIAYASSPHDPKKSLDIEFVPTETGTGKAEIWIIGV
jgi:hypothetical protein